MAIQRISVSTNSGSINLSIFIMLVKLLIKRILGCIPKKNNSTLDDLGAGR